MDVHICCNCRFWAESGTGGDAEGECFRHSQEHPDFTSELQRPFIRQEVLCPNGMRHSIPANPQRIKRLWPALITRWDFYCGDFFHKDGEGEPGCPYSLD